MIIKQITDGCNANIHVVMKLVLTALKHNVVDDERLHLSGAYSLRPTYSPRLEVTDEALPAGDVSGRRALVRLFLSIDVGDSKVWIEAGDGAVIHAQLVSQLICVQLVLLD